MRWHQRLPRKKLLLAPYKVSVLNHMAVLTHSNLWKRWLGLLLCEGGYFWYVWLHESYQIHHIFITNMEQWCQHSSYCSEAAIRGVEQQRQQSFLCLRACTHMIQFRIISTQHSEVLHHILTKPSHENRSSSSTFRWESLLWIVMMGLFVYMTCYRMSPCRRLWFLGSHSGNRNNHRCYSTCDTP